MFRKHLTQLVNICKEHVHCSYLITAFQSINTVCKHGSISAPRTNAELQSTMNSCDTASSHSCCRYVHWKNKSPIHKLATSLNLSGLSFQCWAKSLFLGSRLGLGLGRRSGPFGLGLQRRQAQELTEAVALMQGFELVNERGCTVPFEALIPEK